MSDEMQIEGRSYISSKRASQLSGYAQDYIGQLARKSLIDARRIGGLWYVSMESLEGYKKKAEEYKPEPPTMRPEAQEPGTLVFFDGKEYLSAARAAELTGYAQDYVGQLGRSGKVLSQQVGNRWYVEKESILRHKAEKDQLLAAVQRESVGLSRPVAASKTPSERPSATGYSAAGPLLNYYNENADLLPVTGKELAGDAKGTVLFEASKEAVNDGENVTAYSIPIKRLPPQPRVYAPRRVEAKIAPREGKKSLVPMLLGAIATIVIVLSVGYVSLLKRNSVYAVGTEAPGIVNALPASVETSIGRIGDMLEPLLTRELTYDRIGDQ